MTETQKWCAVTGGRGFVARCLVEMLIRSGSFSVRILDLACSIKLEQSEEDGTLGEALRSGRAQYVSVDLRDKLQVFEALQGCEAVFHMAAPDSSVNDHQLHRSVNVVGTKNTINACVDLKIKRLVYTSSPSVVFDGVHGIFNGDESLPYAAKFIDKYSATKAEAEALVIKSNDIDGLQTCCIRPSSIFGPGDRLLVPSLVSGAKAGKLKFLIGDGNNLCDFTFVENVAHAHICAERTLAAGGVVAEKAGGQAYFVTNAEPIKFWEFVSVVLEGLGYERPRIKIPVIVVMPIAHLVEWIYSLLAPYGMKVPQLTPSRIRLISCSRTFNCSKARELLGYTPIVSLEDGLKKTIMAYSHLKADKKLRRDGASKAFLFLGSGKVADTLLWRDKIQTLATIFVLTAFYYSFIASGCTIITMVSKLLLIIAILLFIHGSFPEKILGYKVEKIPLSNFYIHVETSKQVALSVASSWNSMVFSFKSLCKGTDWMRFIKAIFLLSMLSLIGAVSFQRLFVIGLSCVFIGFFVYEKNEEAIDGGSKIIISPRSPFLWVLCRLPERTY